MLLALSRLETKRGVPLDAASARLLAANFDPWQSLFPYFERLPALQAADFQAIETFAGATTGLEFTARNQLIGCWHSLVELIALGVRAGSIDLPASSRLFRQACAISTSDAFPRAALETLRAIVSQAANLDQGIAEKLLRLDPDKRAAFERVKSEARVPSLDTGVNPQDGAAVLHALAGQVYAAWLDPAGLLISEDPDLIAKHRFINPYHRGPVAPAFTPSAVWHFNVAHGGLFTGGFAGFGEAAAKLLYGGATGGLSVSAMVADPVPGAAPSPAAAPTPAADVFRVDSRLVEVSATVTDAGGRYVDDLAPTRFQVLEQGKPQPLTAFESSSSSLTCAILLDVSGSMEAAMPALKNAVLKLIDELRAGDSIAVYSFNESVNLLQDFTTDHRAAKRSVLKVYPDGMTALYDGLTRVARDLASHSGKKVIVVFTDGSDNSSALTVAAAVRRAKVIGVPVYSIAQGAALRFPDALQMLQGVSTSTGGLSFAIEEPGQIREVFESVAAAIKHGYLLTYRPDLSGVREWRTIEVRVSGAKGLKVRSRDGYYPE